MFRASLVLVSEFTPIYMCLMCSLPVGVRCFGKSQDRDGQADSSAKGHYGLTLGNTLFSEDRENIHDYPLPSTSFLPATCEADLRKFNVLFVDVNNLLENKEQASIESDKPKGICLNSICDLPTHRCAIVIPCLAFTDPEELRAYILSRGEDIRTHLRSRHALTLWELWRFVVDSAHSGFTAEVRCLCYYFVDNMEMWP